MAAVSGPAVPATINCGPKQTVSDTLSKQFGETAFASGVAADQQIKFFGNPRTGSWSMVVIRPDGIACIVAIGEGLNVLPQFNTVAAISQ
jgi:hypothetical protein